MGAEWRFDLGPENDGMPTNLDTQIFFSVGFAEHWPFLFSGRVFV